MRVIGYIRVSQVGGRAGDSFISPQVQRDRIAQLAAAQGHTIVAWQEDLDQPGSTIDRPGLEAAFQLVEAREADAIAVAKLDRFARSVTGAANALARLEAAGANLIAADLGMDTSTPAGKLMRNVLMALAEFELDRIRENWQAATERAVARGAMMTRAKVGYRKSKAGTLELDPVQAPVVREIFRRRALGEGWRAICEHLNATCEWKQGWTITTLMGIVRSRTYLGEARYGDTVNAGAHEPLVTRAEWEAAQQATLLRRPREVGSLLAGIARCAGCGYVMSRETSGAVRAPHRYVFYACRKYHAGGACPAPTKISQPLLDEHVERLFLDRLVDLPVADLQPVDTDRGLVDAVELAEAELVAYRDANLVSILGVEAYRAGLAERAQRVDAARFELQARRRHLVAAVPAVSLLEAWPDLGREERRRILAAGIDAVFVKPAHLGRRGTPVEERCRVLFASDGHGVLLAGRGSGELRPFCF